MIYSVQYFHGSRANGDLSLRNYIHLWWPVFTHIHWATFSKLLRKGLGRFLIL